MFFTSHKTGNEVAARLIYQFIKTADLLQDTSFQNSRPVCDSKCLFKIMAYVDSRQAKPALNTQQLSADFLSCNLIKGANRLIQK